MAAFPYLRLSRRPILRIGRLHSLGSFGPCCIDPGPVTILQAIDDRVCDLDHALLISGITATDEELSNSSLLISLSVRLQNFTELFCSHSVSFHLYAPLT